MARRSDVMQCPECDGQGTHAVDLGGGVFLADEDELVMRSCRICKGRKQVVRVDTTCADCDIPITVTIPPKERIGERVCRDCGGN